MHKCGWMAITALLFIAATANNEARAQEQNSATPKSASGSAAAHRRTAHSYPYERVLLRPSLLRAKAPATYKVKFVTTKGDFVITVTRAWAPLGADRFYNLVRHHFYDNESFFRVLRGFVVQWGISAYPPVAAAWNHAPIKDDPVKESNKRGFVTYAKGGPDSRTTEVFINLRDNNVDPNNLDTMGFAPFGEVTEGMEVVESLYSGYGDGSDMHGKGPVQDVIQKEGKSYLDKDFPLLDSIKTTELILPTAPVHTRMPPKPKAAADKP
jgi:peptidyl-prolyl cis-trans isomerase A (cyclophilin A)